MLQVFISLTLSMTVNITYTPTHTFVKQSNKRFLVIDYHSINLAFNMQVCSIVLYNAFV